jgi:hypothetical protein
MSVMYKNGGGVAMKDVPVNPSTSKGLPAPSLGKMASKMTSPSENAAPLSVPVGNEPMPRKIPGPSANR